MAGWFQTLRLHSDCPSPDTVSLPFCAKKPSTRISLIISRVDNLLLGLACITRVREGAQLGGVLWSGAGLREGEKLAS